MSTSAKHASSTATAWLHLHRAMDAVGPGAYLRRGTTSAQPRDPPAAAPVTPPGKAPGLIRVSWERPCDPTTSRTPPRRLLAIPWSSTGSSRGRSAPVAGPLSRTRSWRRRVWPR
jgi:hypothetical protein